MHQKNPLVHHPLIGAKREEGLPSPTPDAGATTITTIATIALSTITAWALLTSPLCAVAAVGGGKGSAGAISQAAPGRHYDGQGRYTGRIDSDGRRYDAQGRFIGRIDPPTGRKYDSHGRYLGRIEANGHQYDAQGKYLGRVESTGKFYDDGGRYKGRMDAEGRQYDAQGRYTGRLEGTTGNASNSNQPAQPALTLESRRTLEPFVFCNHGDKDCGH
jgi:hypothetical protein